MTKRQKGSTRGRRGDRKVERNERMVWLRVAMHWTYQQIADEYGISKCRAWEIVTGELDDDDA